jgi:hypothetical protein
MAEEPLAMSEVFSTRHNATLDSIIGELEIRYPDEFPDHNLPLSEIAFRAGCVSVVRYLKSLRPDG